MRWWWKEFCRSEWKYEKFNKNNMWRVGRFERFQQDEFAFMHRIQTAAVTGATKLFLCCCRDFLFWKNSFIPERFQICFVGFLVSRESCLFFPHLTCVPNSTIYASSFSIVNDLSQPPPASSGVDTTNLPQSSRRHLGQRRTTTKTKRNFQRR